MAGVARANWHVEAVGAPLAEDPFEAPIEEVGERIDLSDASQRLRVRLLALARREARLADGGVTCEIKDRQDTACSACPVCQANNYDHPLALLCKTGREQEAVCTELAAAQLTGGQAPRPPRAS